MIVPTIGRTAQSDHNTTKWSLPAQGALSPFLFKVARWGRVCETGGMPSDKTVPPSLSLAEELKQTQPFRGLGHEIYISLMLTASRAGHGTDMLLKKHGVTQGQYNVLRILDGAGPGGLGRNEIGDRLVHAMPDVTRLLDRMEKLGWVSRVRDREDRRLVSTTITAAGKKLVKGLEKPINDLHLAQVVGIDESDLRRLLETLGELRRNLGYPHD